MTDIAVIILVGKEELHIRRCLEKLAPLEPRQIFVVESQKGDRTHEIAVEMGATTVWHDWPGLYGTQFNWALDNCKIETRWVLRLDADEYLTPETIELIKKVIETNQDDEVTGYSLELGRTFWGEPVCRGVGRMWLGRLFRAGIGRCEDKKMDEHIVVSKGRIEPLIGGKFIDDNLNGIDWWSQKHLGYAAREAQDALEGFKKGQKGLYYKLPPYWRALAYFIYRYILRGGFLEGRRGFKWHFFQGLWYRMLVDAKIEGMRGEGKRE